MSETSEEIAVPQMVNLDALTKIVIAFYKVGGAKSEVTAKEVSQISGVSATNVSINNKFFVSLGILEGKQGSYRLTPLGCEYAKALDWGRLEEAQAILKKIIKEKTLVQRTTSFVDLNKPVSKDDLISKVASFANVPNEPRFSTGIKAFVEMLILSKILEETKDGTLISAVREEPKETSFKENVEDQLTIKQEIFKQIRNLEDLKRSVADLNSAKFQGVSSSATFAFTITINVDNNTDPEKLKSLIKALKEAIGTNAN